MEHFICELIFITENQAILNLTITRKYTIIYIYSRDYCKTASGSTPFVHNREYLIKLLISLYTNQMKKSLIFPEIIEKSVSKTAK